MKGSFIIFIAVLFLAVSAQFFRDNICSDVLDGETALFPHESNCSLYYRCTGSEQKLIECFDGLWFNNALQSCDYPETSGCLNPTTPTTPTIDPRCDGNNTDYLPHPTDCTKYIQCYAGESSEMNCPAGLWFNAVEKKCDMPTDSGCSNGTTTTTTPAPTWTTPDPICWGVLPGQTILKPYEGDCNKYWKCYGSQKTEMSCPPYFHFNEEKQFCDWPELTNCTVDPDPTSTANPYPPTTSESTNRTEASTVNPNPPTTPEGNNDPRCADEKVSYWPHPIDCNKYIECYKGQGYEVNCPDGLYFDSVSKKCTNPSESDCGKTNPPTNNPTETTTKTSGITDDPDCLNTGSALLPFEGDCTKYWQCDNGQKVLKNCPSGLYFNPNLHICDYPYQAGCEWRRWSDFISWIFRDKL